MKRKFLFCLRRLASQEMIKFAAILFLFLIYSISPWFFLTDTRAEQIDNNEITGLWFGTYTANQGETSLLINIFNDNSQDTKAIFIFGPTYRNSSVPSGSFYMDGIYDQETSKIDLVGIEWIDRPTNYYMLDLSGIISIVGNKMRMTGGTYESINDPFPFGSGKQGDFLLTKVDDSLYFEEGNNELVGFWSGTYTATQGETSLLINIFNENSQDTKAIFIFGPTYRNSSVPSGSFYMNVTYDKESASIELVGIEWIDRPSNYQMVDMSGVVSVFENKTRMTGGIYRTGSKRGDFLLIRRCVRTVLDTPTAQGFVYPVWISIEDAGRTKPFTSQEFGDGLGHLGEDYAYPIGRNVRAAYEGKVVGSGFHGQTAISGFGNYIIIRHEHPALPNNGVIYSFYAHLDKIFKHSGEFVKTGEVIGEIGNTGKSDGPHLHFEIKTGADFGSGYTGEAFSTYTIDHSGMTYYRPSTFIETYRSLSPTQPKRISLPGVMMLLLDDTIHVNKDINQAIKNARDNIGKTSGYVSWEGETYFGIWADENITYCARFVRMCYGLIEPFLPTAKDLYDHYYSLGLIKTNNNTPLGAVVFYDYYLDGINYGHVGIVSEAGKLISVTSLTTGVNETPIFNHFSGQYLGYVTAYDYINNHYQ